MMRWAPFRNESWQSDMPGFSQRHGAGMKEAGSRGSSRERGKREYQGKKGL